MLDTKTEYQLCNQGRKFIRDNYDALLEKYPEHWIAVTGREVIAAEPDPFELIAKMRELGPFPDPGNMTVELMTSEEIDWIHPW